MARAPSPAREARALPGNDAFALPRFACFAGVQLLRLFVVSLSCKPLFCGFQHGFEPRIITDAVQIGIDFGMIDITGPHLFECRANHRESCVLVLQVIGQCTCEVVAHRQIFRINQQGAAHPIFCSLTLAQHRQRITAMGEFRYSSLLTPINPGPIILSANTTYVLAAAFAGGTDTFRSNNSSTQATFDPAVTSGNGRASTGGFSFPSTNNGPGSFVGPNAIFSLVSNGNGVPEGGATAVLMLGSFALLLGLRRVVRM